MTTTEIKADITEVWLPGEGNSHNECFRVGHNGVTAIEKINEFHGEYDMNWIIVRQGSVIHRINEKQITELVLKVP